MKSDALPEKDIPVFKKEHVDAMGPAARGIAEILRDAGWIRIDGRKAK
jgi:hypothetical protein